MPCRRCGLVLADGKCGVVGGLSMRGVRHSRRGDTANGCGVQRRRRQDCDSAIPFGQKCWLSGFAISENSVHSALIVQSAYCTIDDVEVHLSPNCEAAPMKRLALTAFVLVFAVATVGDAQAGLLDLFSRGGGGDCCQPDPCCKKKHFSLFSSHKNSSCCEPAACCAPAPTCCAPAPTCCAPAPTCAGSAQPRLAPKVPYEETPPKPKKGGGKKPAPKA